MTTTKPLRNPHFEDQSYTDISWTRVVRDKYPYRHRTVCCQHTAKAGDIVITVPVIRDGATVATAVIHQACLAHFLEGVPDDDMIVAVKEQSQSIMERFQKD